MANSLTDVFGAPSTNISQYVELWTGSATVGDTITWSVTLADYDALIFYADDDDGSPTYGGSQANWWDTSDTSMGAVWYKRYSGTLSAEVVCNTDGVPTDTQVVLTGNNTGVYQQKLTRIVGVKF